MNVGVKEILFTVTLILSFPFCLVFCSHSFPPTELVSVFGAMIKEGRLMIRYFSYSLVIYPSLGKKSYKLNLSSTFWLLNKNNENKIIFNSNHILLLVSDKIKVFIAATQKEAPLASGNAVHVSSENILALKSKSRKHLNDQSNV